MKRISPIVVVALMVFQISCTKDDGEIDSNSNEIKTPLEILQDGKWNMLSLSQVITAGDSVVGNQTAEVNSQWAFLSNNILVSYFYDSPTDTTIYKFDDTTLVIDDLNYEVLTFTEQDLVIKSKELYIRPTDSVVLELITEISLDR